MNIETYFSNLFESSFQDSEIQDYEIQDYGIQDYGIQDYGKNSEKNSEKNFGRNFERSLGSLSDQNLYSQKSNSHTFPDQNGNCSRWNHESQNYISQDPNSNLTYENEVAKDLDFDLQLEHFVEKLKELEKLKRRDLSMWGAEPYEEALDASSDTVNADSNQDGLWADIKEVTAITGLGYWVVYRRLLKGKYLHRYRGKKIEIFVTGTLEKKVLAYRRYLEEKKKLDEMYVSVKVVLDRQTAYSVIDVSKIDKAFLKHQDRTLLFELSLPLRVLKSVFESAKDCKIQETEEE